MLFSFKGKKNPTLPYFNVIPHMILILRIYSGVPPRLFFPLKLNEKLKPVEKLNGS